MTAGSLEWQSLTPSYPSHLPPLFFFSVFLRPGSQTVSVNAMRDKVKKTEVLSSIKTDLNKEIRASHELGLTILTPSKVLATIVSLRLVGALAFRHKVIDRKQGVKLL